MGGVRVRGCQNGRDGLYKKKQAINELYKPATETGDAHAIHGRSVIHIQVEANDIDAIAVPSQRLQDAPYIAAALLAQPGVMGPLLGGWCLVSFLMSDYQHRQLTNES